MSASMAALLLVSPLALPASAQLDRTEQQVLACAGLDGADRDLASELALALQRVQAERAAIEAERASIEQAMQDLLLLADTVPAAAPPEPKPAVPARSPAGSSHQAPQAVVGTIPDVPGDGSGGPRQLVKVVEKMKPAAAAAVVARLEPQLAENVIKGMKPASAAKLLAALPPDRAAHLARAMTQEPRGGTP